MYHFLVKMNLPPDIKPSIMASRIRGIILENNLSDKVHVLPMGDEDVSSLHTTVSPRVQKGGPRETKK